MQNPFRYFNSSPEIIRLAVMMYVRFPLSLRQVEDLLSERGIDICHETVRFWWNRFGPLFAAETRKRRVHRHCYSNWRWHLDEVFVRINGKTHYLWRAVDHEGEVLEVFATKRRDRRAALRFPPPALPGFRGNTSPSATLPARPAPHGVPVGACHATDRCRNGARAPVSPVLLALVAMSEIRVITRSFHEDHDLWVIREDGEAVAFQVSGYGTDIVCVRKDRRGRGYAGGLALRGEAALSDPAWA